MRLSSGVMNTMLLWGFQEMTAVIFIDIRLNSGTNKRERKKSQEKERIIRVGYASYDNFSTQ